ncbi:MAG: PHP domain-containing protein [Deltaproteobacteria bacterium]|nr:PHP domain-containing protein [Deltaproteobacteria bacterium]
MKIDLHIHSIFSDGRMGVEDIFHTAKERNVDLLSITDHDSLDSQQSAGDMAARYGMLYLSGIELNVTYSHPRYQQGKTVSLDFLGYGYDIRHGPLAEKLTALRDYREKRARIILDRVNEELAREGLPRLTPEDMREIQNSVDGTFGRPHIADYLVRKGLAGTRQDAFDRYLVKCNVPKMPLSLAEASSLIRDAGGKVIFAHPGNPRGTSLVALTSSVKEQQEIIRETMLPHIDGVECWHSSHDAETSTSYLSFTRELGLMATGGSDCHQQPLLLGTVRVPEWVADQFDFHEGHLGMPRDSRRS